MLKYLLSLCLIIMSAPLAAMNDDAAEMAQIEIVAGWPTEDGGHMAAIRVQLADGWHTYWRAPGDAGFPPSLTQTRESTVTKASLHWPRPQLFTLGDVRYLGYKGDVIIPIKLHGSSEGDIKLDAYLDIGVCDKICIPLRVHLQKEFSPKSKGTDVALIRAALRDGPTTLKNVSCKARPMDDGMHVTAQIKLPPLAGYEFAVLEMKDRDIWVSQAMITRDGNTLSIESEMIAPTAEPFSIDRSTIRVSVFGANQSYEAIGCPAPK